MRMHGRGRVDYGCVSVECCIAQVREKSDREPTGHVGVGERVGDVGPGKTGPDVFIFCDVGVVVVDYELVGKYPVINKENAEGEQEID